MLKAKPKCTAKTKIEAAVCQTTKMTETMALCVYKTISTPCLATDFEVNSMKN